MPRTRSLGGVLTLAAGLALAGCGQPIGAEPNTSGTGATTSHQPSATSGPPGVTPVTTAGSSRPGLPTRIPPHFKLPNEGEPAWRTDNARGTEWLLDPCLPTDYPTDRRRTDFRTVSTEGPEYRHARQLGVYADAATAREVVAGFRRVLDACRTGDRDGNIWRWETEELSGVGEEGVLTGGYYGPRGVAGAVFYVAVTRVGNWVFLAYSSGEGLERSISDPAIRSEVADVARAFARSV
jgi:hypothetical protein